MELKDEEKQRESFGMEITLSRSAETPIPERKPYIKKSDRTAETEKRKPKPKAEALEKSVTVESAV